MAARREQTTRLGSTVRSAAQMRTLNAALDLFAEYGVAATSYQMIADAIGVTKGAIYHQFKTRDEIIIAVAEMKVAKLEDALEAAESEDDSERGRELLLNHLIDHAIEHRRAANTFQFDPVIVRLLSGHKPFHSFIERLYGMLVGDAAGAGQGRAAGSAHMRRGRHRLPPACRRFG
jgi:AcrR family transcriptional regulator